MTRGTVETRDRAELEALLADLGREARRFRFEVAPNPCVGAAVLSSGVEVARGYHEVYGEGHAEVQALRAAELSGIPKENWDTIVITLEPCSSQGKTPPCVEAILSSGIRRVVVGELDPDSRHRGRGLEQLAEAGLEVILLQGVAPLSTVSPFFEAWTQYERLRRPRPWTIAKWAQTRTGQLTPPEDVGEGRWISCADSLEEVQVLRSRVDAVVTGIGTVRADDPRFTVRPPADPSSPPMRVVLDSYLKTPPQSRLFDPAPEGCGAGEVFLLSLPGLEGGRQEPLMERGANLVALHSNGNKQIALREVQEWLWSQGVRRVLLECGPTLLGRYFELGFIDQLRIYTGGVNGGRGESMGSTISGLKLSEREDRESGEDSVLEAFVS